METPSPEDLVGRVIAGRYRIERALKRGGMGQVYVAKDGDKSVAIKVVRQSLLEDAAALTRFKREARLATELVHDNIVTSLATGEDGGLLWIAMELLEGESLRERLDARGRMPWLETLTLIEQVVKALQAAHDKGIIHRDLKPENVMLAQDGKAKLLDFGVAKQARVDGDATSNMTGTGLIVGTPGYVAPEVVLEGKTDDPRSDFYALGVTWFEMLTGQKPFTAKTAFALAMRHAHEPAPTPTSLVPYSPVPAPIERLVLRLLAKSPEERPQSAQALLDALANLAEESQRALTGTPPPSALDPAQPTMTATDLGKHGTDVVKFTPTPRPPGSPGPPGSLGDTPRPPGSLGDTPRPPGSNPGTPLTAMQTPPPDWSQLKIPRKVIAAAAAGLVALVAVTAGVVAIVVNARTGPTPEAVERRREERAEVRAETRARLAANEPPPVAFVGAVPSSAPVPAAAALIAATAPTAPAVPPRRREERPRHSEPPPPPPSAPTSSKPAEPVLPGTLRFRPVPADAAWHVGIDGGTPVETPHSFTLAPGAHDVRYVSSKLHVDVVMTMFVKAGDDKVVREAPKAP